MAQVTPLSPRQFADLDAGLMVTRVTAGYFAEHPELGERERIRMRPDCERDLNAHYRFLQAAMIYGTPRVFEQYTRWLGDVYRHHRLPKDYLVDTFRLLGAYLERHLPEATAALAVGLLASARETLRGAVVEVPGPSRRGLRLAGAGDFTQALVGGDSGVAGSVAERALAGGLGLVDVAVGVIQPSMYEIGYLWQTNRITVAQEHLATAIAQTVLGRILMAQEYAEPNGRRALFACVENNHHALGLQMVSDAFEVDGWEVDYLGADTPGESILQMIDQRAPQLVGLSISMPLELTTLAGVVDMIKGEFAATRPAIVIGGQLFNEMDKLALGLGADLWFVNAKDAVEGI